MGTTVAGWGFFMEIRQDASEDRGATDLGPGCGVRVEANRWAVERPVQPHPRKSLGSGVSQD